MKILSVISRVLLAFLFLWAGVALAAPTGDNAALVTVVEGKVSRVSPSGRQPVQAFATLKKGELLALEGASRIQMVFFESKRQENWSGVGRLEITATEGKGHGLPEPRVKVLPDILVKQFAKTPSLDSEGRAGMVRLRSIGMPDALEKLESDYKRLRMEAERDDLNPEIFLLAGLLEMRQFDRLEQALADLHTSHQGNMEASVLVALYQKTLKNIRESGK